MADGIKHFISNKFGGKGLSGTFEETAPVSNNPKANTADYDKNIDLRSIYPYSCSPVYHKNRVHYLDRDSEQYLQRLLDRNKDIYTEEMYHSVVKYASSAVPASNPEEKQNAVSPPIVIPAGYSQHRQESRLNFATDVEIEMPSGTVILARSVDISASGIQLKVKQLLDVINDMELQLSFPQLEAQHEKSFGSVTYVLKKNTVGSLFMSLFLVRKDPGEDSFDIFIEEFIRLKKHRYRIDSEDSAMALTSKAWEYLYIKSLPYLACFISTANERIQIQEIAISESNNHQLNGLGNSMLSHLESKMSTFRLNGIARQESAAPEIYAYRYRGDGLRRKVCATSWQFKEPAAKLTFLHAGIKQDSFSAWRVEVVELKALPKSRSQELLAKLVKESPVQAENLVDQLNQYDHLLYLVEITDQLKRDPLLTEHQGTDELPDYFFDDYEIPKRKAADFTRLRLGIAKRRNEQRFIYRSPVTIKLYGEKIKATTIDFSVNGLKISTDKSSTFQIRDTVSLEFTGFNKKFRTAKLKTEPYRVVAITPDGDVCLCRDHRVSRHKAAIFLKKLIDKNVEILEHCTGEVWMSTKARLIEAWMHQCLPTQPLLVARKNNKYHVPYIIHSDTTDELLAPFSIGDNLYDLKPLMGSSIITGTFKHIAPQEGHILNHEIFVTKQLLSDTEVVIKYWTDFDSDLARAEYVRGQLKTGMFKVYHLAFSKIPKLDKSDLADDMNVIRKNARHRLLEFEETYHSLVGILEISDATEQVRLRYNLDRHSII